MLCPKCGATMAETDAFCSNCGSMSMTVENSIQEEPTRHPPEQIYPEKPTTEAPAEKSNSSGKLKVLSIILAITTVLSLAFAAYVFYVGTVTADRLERTTADHADAVNTLNQLQTQLETQGINATELQQALEQATALLEAAETERDTLSAQVSSLREEKSALEQEIAFYDAYVVFVMPENTDKLYHNYACAHFQPQGFVAYNVKLAQSNGYSPCPDCCG